MSARTVEEYLALPYRMEIYWDETYWAAEFPELPGLVAGHETWEGLLTTIEDAKRSWFEAMIEDGKPIPEPGAEDDRYSGKFNVRVPRRLHAELARAATHDQVSLNTFVVAALARAVGERAFTH